MISLPNPANQQDTTAIYIEIKQQIDESNHTTKYCTCLRKRMYKYLTWRVYMYIEKLQLQQNITICANENVLQDTLYTSDTCKCFPGVEILGITVTCVNNDITCETNTADNWCRRHRATRHRTSAFRFVTQIHSLIGFESTVDSAVSGSPLIRLMMTEWTTCDFNWYSRPAVLNTHCSVLNCAQQSLLVLCKSNLWIPLIYDGISKRL